MGKIEAKFPQTQKVYATSILYYLFVVVQTEPFTMTTRIFHIFFIRPPAI